MKALVFCEDIDLKEFFLKAFKKERYLDMRLTAIRGYAKYATEKEVEKLMSKFTEILMKRPESTTRTDCLMTQSYLHVNLMKA
ncbi:hypothetical protein J22TS3_00090 [Paenibacillus sp. J22TS3]|nr:hypothetical protein J22TS3_00090 [Paenibacillus sp. J22TS3]